MAVWRLQVNTGGANVADYCLQNHVAALWAGKVLAMERLSEMRDRAYEIIYTLSTHHKGFLYVLFLLFKKSD